jgi:hypothetical protein
MTGPEHYEEAELLLERSAAGSNPGSVARAQVHATLALAAVTAISDPALGLPAEVRDMWWAVAGGTAATS